MFEIPDANRATNIVRARDGLRAARAHLSPEHQLVLWEAATHELANSLAADPAGDPGSRSEAMDLLDTLLTWLRTRGDVAPVATVLGTLARLWSTSPIGDATENLEHALVLQQEAVRLAESARGTSAWERVRWGTQLHNLGAIYRRRLRGSASENISAAIQAFELALTARTVQADPIGRARTLRQLAAAYPGSGVGESLVHEEAMAAAALAEAKSIEESNETEAARSAGRSALTRRDSALSANLDNFPTEPRETAIAWLEAMTADHRQALALICREDEPVLWAQWTGGLGRLLSLRTRIGRWDLVDETRQSFRDALSAINRYDQARLWRDLQGHLGQWCHEIRDWETSVVANDLATEAGREVFDVAGTLKSRQTELAATFGSALFAAYAAARLGRLEDAVRTAAEYVRLSSELRAARSQLRDLLAEAAAAHGADGAGTAAEVQRISVAARYPIVYLLTTTHGSMGVAVLPGRPIEAISLPEMTSDQALKLLMGDGQPGYLAGSNYGKLEAFGRALATCLSALGPRIMAPLADWLTDRGYARAVLIPLGRIGLLPLIAAAPPGVAWSYAPSARGLGFALASRGRRANRETALLAVADPGRQDLSPLPLAVAEARSAALRFSPRAVVLCGAAASAAALRAEVSAATHVHLACHGVFRPSNPLASTIMLAGTDQITVSEILRRDVDISGAKLIVLSACQSAAVDAPRPDETLGFPTALLMCGVSGVLTTQWPIDDAAAALFCHAFYERLLGQGMEAASAVSATQRWLREATATALQASVDALHDVVATEGYPRTKAALTQLWRNLRSLPLEHRPFAAPEHWAAFVYCGV